MTRSILMAFGSVVLAFAQQASSQLPPGAMTPTQAEIERTVPPIGQDIPFRLVDGFIMLEGVVNGESGFYMLDTGSPFALFLNNHLLTLGPSRQIASGSAGSGQRVVVLAHENVDSLTMWGDVRFRDVRWAQSADFGFIEDGIVPQYLGFIGHGILKNFEFTIDYDRSNLFFSRLDPDGEALVSRVPLEDVHATLMFACRDCDRQYDQIPFRLGEIPLTLGIDTGNSGGQLTLTARTKEALEHSGHLTAQGDSYILEGLEHEEVSFSVDGLRVMVGETDGGTLGYSFLRQFKTVWNYQLGTLVLVR
ncbi:MAG: hypothetical protein CME17_02515 [Gemmatimonadetes bacterium]|nr:hypothetical protein [Gemmatimonadota bacterium]